MKATLAALMILSLADGSGLTRASAAEGESNVQSVTMKKGVVVAVVDGSSLEATNEIVFPKNITVQTNGLYTIKGGPERALREGQSLSREGMLSSPDGSVVPAEDHLVARKGRVLLVKNGEAAPLTGAFVLKNGDKVSPDGTIVTPRNLIKRLLDGQILRLDETAPEATDTARIEKGKVLLYKDGGRIELRPGQVMMMSDGSKVDARGQIVRRDGSRTALKEGETFRFSGAGDSGK